MLSLSCPVLNQVGVGGQKPTLGVALSQPVVADDVATSGQTAQELHCSSNLQTFSDYIARMATIQHIWQLHYIRLEAYVV